MEDPMRDPPIPTSPCSKLPEWCVPAPLVFSHYLLHSWDQVFYVVCIPAQLVTRRFSCSRCSVNTCWIKGIVLKSAIGSKIAGDSGIQESVESWSEGNFWPTHLSRLRSSSLLLILIQHLYYIELSMPFFVPPTDPWACFHHSTYHCCLNLLPWIPPPSIQSVRLFRAVPFGSCLHR